MEENSLEHDPVSEAPVEYMLCALLMVHISGPGIQIMRGLDRVQP